MNVTIVIADDHAIVRQGLVRLISEEPDLTVVGQAEDSASLLDLLRRVAPSVLLLDQTMPGRGGLETLSDIRKLHPGIRVLLLSMHPEEHYAVRAIRAGASGYLTKGAAPEELIRAVRTIAAGGRYLSGAVADAMADELAGGTRRTGLDALSDRELQVLKGIAEGRTVTEIAGAMSLSVKTVSTYRTRILEKLKMKTTAELVRFAVDSRL